jgi:GNAT superfamily N-acetyltransferase
MTMDLRPATAGDADAVAGLETARTPDDPRSGAMVTYWWEHAPDSKHAMRLIGDGIYVSARHRDWNTGGRRFGTVYVVIHPEAWSPELYRDGLDRGESWLRSENAEVSVVRIREDFGHELAVARELDYREVRRERFWELDLVARRAELLAGAERARAEMARQGIEMLTLDRADDPATLHQLHALDNESTKDIPTTVPNPDLLFEEWLRLYFENPGVRKDRFWIARAGDEVVGMSLIAYPPGRGVPATDYTGTSPRHRGRGIARALKYQTIAQAIEVGATRVRTDNDSENVPILHINAEMGYQPMTPRLELHRDL